VCDGEKTLAYDESVVRREIDTRLARIQAEITAHGPTLAEKFTTHAAP
jgi:hypothetical protein